MAAEFATASTFYRAAFTILFTLRRDYDKACLWNKSCYKIGNKWGEINLKSLMNIITIP